MQRHLVPGVRCIWVVDVFPPKSVLIVERVSKAGRSGSGAYERECEMVLDSSESGRPSNIYNSQKRGRCVQLRWGLSCDLSSLTLDQRVQSANEHGALKIRD